jgi:hypothetical protein
MAEPGRLDRDPDFAPAGRRKIEVGDFERL